MSQRVKKISTRPSLFTQPGKNIAARSGKRDVLLKELSDTSFGSTGSFRYDSPGMGIKSTQQIPVDYSSFVNHTFFDSAQSKTNVAFDTIINNFPFDGTEKFVEKFFDSLTGFENYIFGLFPKYTGYLHFSGTVVDEDPAHGFSADLGTLIKVIDSRGYEYPQFSIVDDGKAAIDFGTSPFSFEFHLFVPPRINFNQVIFQKKTDAANDISIALSGSASTSECNLIFSVNSGSTSLMASGSVTKGEFNHCCAIYNAGTTDDISIYLNNSILVSSSNSARFDSLSFDRSSLIIGSGSVFNVDSKMMPGGQTTFIPKTTFSGSLDEVRVFHTVRSVEVQKDEGKKDIYPTARNKLTLYFKFNEPTGSYKPAQAVLDSSGNAFHSNITNFSEALRITGSVESPIVYEKSNLNPILFPDHYLVTRLNARLLTSASKYDDANPNLITKLIPPHFFIEGQQEQGFATEQGQIYNQIEGSSIPGSAKLGSAQMLTAFLFIYAKFFDELKIVIDSISNFLNVDYDDFDTIPDQLIPSLAKYYGIEIPSLFTSSTIFEFIDGENLGDDFGYSTRSLRELQNILWKRFLINLPYMMRSKGTISSVKSTIRSFGIDPDELMNIREFGGPTTKSLKDLRTTRVKSISLLDFSGSINNSPSAVDFQGFSSNLPRFITPYLSASRVEPGYPPIQGTFVDKTETNRNGISNNAEDGLLTSGSFTFESFYRFLEPNRLKKNQILSQSLARIHITGSSVGQGAVVANLIAISSSSPTLNLYVRSSILASRPGIKLVLTGAQIFNGDPWYVSFGRVRSDDTITSLSQSYLAPQLSTVGSSSYFLKCGRSSNGKVSEEFYTSDFFKDEGLSSVFENLSGLYNVSGTFAVIGSQSLGTYTNRFLSDTSLDSATGFSSGDREMAMTTNFCGQVGKTRFWSKAMGSTDFIDHTLSPDSIGSINPTISYNFVTQNTGSFGRARIDCQMSQPIKSASAAGNLTITNFTQEIGDVECFGFEQIVKSIKSEGVFYTMLSPNFDLAQTDEKIRVRGYQSIDLINRSDYATSSPVYEVLKSESPDDDTRFAVEFSAVKALEEDIMTIFSSLEYFDNALGDPNLLFDEFYPDLEQARKVYFRRLFEKPGFENYFRMFKWFSNSLGYVIEQLIPKKTKFLGVDFIFESHPLERNRFRYLFDEIYLIQNERSFDRGELLLSLYTTEIKKF